MSINARGYTGSINRARMKALFDTERKNCVSRMPKSKALSQRAAQHLLFGVPLHWMSDWPTPFTLYVEQAKGAQLTDVDGHQYTDFCLGDTGAMFGHSPEPVVRALEANIRHGFTTMLPAQSSVLVAEELANRFGLPFWQFALTATDANRFVLRWARAATNRKKILVFNGCYHGTVDDVFVDLVEGRPQQRESLLGQAHDLKLFTEVIEFNDLSALDKALQSRDIACVLAEPVMTNVGMIVPQPGYWEKAQTIISSHGTLLALDETHTISSGMNGYSGAFGLKPDLFILGKPIAGGLAGAVYGFSKDVAMRAQNAKRNAPPGHSGIGTTLSANMLTMAAIHANLTQVMTDEAYKHMMSVSEHLANNLRSVIKKYNLPWCVTQIGARTEFQFSATQPLNGTEADKIMDAELEKTIHLYLLNRGIIITPFHNMMLVSPYTTYEQANKLALEFSSLLEMLTL